MCTPVRCSKCKKVGWVGCGAHVEQVLRNVPDDDRCRCREAEEPRDAAASWLSDLLSQRR